MTKRLVVVESPAKAKTIAKYLGDDFEVLASVGHIRDLAEPKEVPADRKTGSMAKFAIDIENDFEPYYVISPGKTKTVSEIKAALKNADELYLATDEDREGEAIAWHLLSVLKPKVPVKRMVFNEITKDAIQAAYQNTRDIDDNLVAAQETRRVVDRLFGYEVSPILWRKINRGLSAGRVQSPAMRMVVQRERERMAHVTAGYGSITALMEHPEANFEAKLAAIDSVRVASGKSFDADGKLTGDFVVLSAQELDALVTKLSGTKLAVTSVEPKPTTRKPAAPFTTSTLQQDASKKLGLSAKQTMDLAQQLYQEGHITYMRTDSPNLSSQAIAAARSEVETKFGKEFLSDSPRQFGSKNKNAQEAHEAVRPSGEKFLAPGSLPKSLSAKAIALYELIYKRTVASQMAEAKLSTTTVKLQIKDGSLYEFSASGTVVLFKGFLAAYDFAKQKDKEKEADEEDIKLPGLAVGESLAAIELSSKEHRTQPPARFTEASLVKALEEAGIGRPSTYAAIISTLINKNYVFKQGSALVPEWIAFTVTRFLEENFDDMVDYAFTAGMEADLDRIATGELDRSDWLKRFYFGDGDGAGDAPGLLAIIEGVGDSDPRSINSFEISPGITLRTGKYGPYIETMVAPGSEGADENGRRIISLPEGMTPDELTPQRAQELIDAPIAGDRVLGVEPESGKDIIVKDGRYGPYVQIVDESLAKPKTASLFKSMNVNDVSLDQALMLLSLPRTIGPDPESGNMITAQNGKFGPYIKKGSDSRSLESEEKIFELELEHALEIFAQPKYGGRRTAATPLKEFGEDPASNQNVFAKTGQFGDYVTDGVINATIPKDEPLEEITSDRAFELLAIRREKLGVEPGVAPKSTKRKPARRVKKG